jgi:hypothetical protein
VLRAAVLHVTLFLQLSLPLPFATLCPRFRQALRWYWDHDEVLQAGGSQLVLLLPGESAFLEFQM